MQSIYDALPNDTDFSDPEDSCQASRASTSPRLATDTPTTPIATAPIASPPACSTQAGRIVLDVVDGLDGARLARTRSATRHVLLRCSIARPSSGRCAPASSSAGSSRSSAGSRGSGWLARLRRSGGVRNLVTTLLWAVIASGAVLGALVAGVWLVRTGRAELHPWFASPWRLFSFMTVMVVTVSWLVRRVAALVPGPMRPDGTPFGVWFAALPVWVALLVGALLYAPAASYLISLPAARRGRARHAVHLAGRGPVLWGGHGQHESPAPRSCSSRGRCGRPTCFALLPFAVTLLGRLPVVTPTWAYPAVFFFAGILLWPPLLAVLIGRVRWRLRAWRRRGRADARARRDWRPRLDGAGFYGRASAAPLRAVRRGSHSRHRALGISPATSPAWTSGQVRRATWPGTSRAPGIARRSEITRRRTCSVATCRCLRHRRPPRSRRPSFGGQAMPTSRSP